MNTKSILLKQINQLPGIENVELIAIEPEEPDYILAHIYFDPASVVDRLTAEEVALRNYNATVKRGQINEKTSFYNFISKLDEEVSELYKSANADNSKFDPSELADISLVCDAMAIHYAIDLQAEKEKKMIVNENRED